MDRLTDSQNRFTEEGEQFEQAPGGLTKITTDTEDMPSTHTKLLSSPIYAVFVESSQMQSRKKADDIVGTSSSSPKRNLERRGRARKIERKGDKEAQGLYSSFQTPEFASTLTSDTDFGENSESEALVLQRADDESPPFIPCASYIDFFVPELFDIQPTLPVRELTDLSAPEDDPHSYQPSASISSSQTTQAEIKAEYLQFVVVSIMWCWRLVWQGFWLLKTALRVLVHEGFASEIVNSVVIDSCEFTDDPCEFADDSIDGSAEPVPPRIRLFILISIRSFMLKIY
ncbi:hypothetical protein B0H14DRAFT_2624898 [Mycena olivaceomarginata]|nr:hypothetical protein B0H14DRAFT_2624898 [Mycena olivaceomarginata]